VAFGSSLDQIGVFGRSVHDAGRVLSVISGRDQRDATCDERDPLRLPTVPESLSGFVIGIPKEYFPSDLDPGVRRACDRAIRLLKDLGAAVREVSLPHTSYAVPAYYIVAPAEASSNLARYDGVRYGARSDDAADVRSLYRNTRGEGFGPEVRRRILVGTYVLSSGYYDAYYRKAQQARALIAQDFRNAFDRGVDLLFTPTTPTTAFKAGEKLRGSMAAAMMHELGMPELIAPDEAAYIRLAVDMADNVELRQPIAEKVREIMANRPRFVDSVSYAARIGPLFKTILAQ